MKCLAMTGRLGLGLMILALTAPGGARAFDNFHSSISLHVVQVHSGQPATCTVPGLNEGTLQPHTFQLSSPDGPFYYVYLLVCDASDSTKVGGFECGITYPGSYNPAGDPTGPITVFSWTNCATMEFPSTGWPAPGGGNAITWSAANCPGTRSLPSNRYSVIAIGGFFYLGAYAPSRMMVTRRPVSGHASVADCQARTDYIDQPLQTSLGWAGFGQVGYNACGEHIIPVQPTTWSAIKSTYGH